MFTRLDTCGLSFVSTKNSFADQKFKDVYDVQNFIDNFIALKTKLFYKDGILKFMKLKKSRKVFIQSIYQPYMFRIKKYIFVHFVVKPILETLMTMT